MGFFRRIFNLFGFRFSWGEERIDKHPKTARLYQKGLLGRWAIFFIALILTAVAVGCEFAFWYGISIGEWGMFIIAGIPALILIPWATNYLLTFASLAFSQYRKGVRYSIQLRAEKKAEKEAEQQLSAEITETSTETPTENGLSSQVTETGHTTTINTSKPEKITNFKPHKIFDFFFSLTSLACFIIVPIAVIVIPFIIFLG